LNDYAVGYEVARNGIAFLESRQNSEGWMVEENGEPSHNIACYYKTLWAFQSAGRLSRANAVADVLRKGFLRKNGDFGDAAQRKGEEWFEWRYYTYPNIWIVIGAQKLGRFDLSMPGTDFLLKFQDPRTGGFCNEAVYPRGAQLEDTLTTSACGNAVLYAGRTREATKAGDFLIRVLKLQPELKTKFYAAMNSRKAKLVEDYDDKDAIYRVVDSGVREQYYFMVGLPIAFLSKLYLATADRKYLVAAKEYYAFTERCTDYAYHYPASGKSGFAAAILSRITGSKGVADSAKSQLGYYAETQGPQGSWTSFPGLKAYGDGAPFPIVGQIDITAEFTVWANEMLQELK
jgi:hypothetical protein